MTVSGLQWKRLSDERFHKSYLEWRRDPYFLVRLKVDNDVILPRKAHTSL